VKRTERGYAHRSLYDKLGVTAGSRVALVGTHDESFVTELNVRLAQGAALRLRTIYDLIFVRVDLPSDLASIARAAIRLEQRGALWVFHPKGRGAAPTDAEVRAAALAAGLVDNKISAYSATHTATRYVIPLVRRTS
jgi:hypothetical protein